MNGDKLLRFSTVLAFQFLCNISLILSEGFVKQIQNFSFNFFMVGMELIVYMLHGVFGKVNNVPFFASEFLANSN